MASRAPALPSREAARAQRSPPPLLSRVLRWVTNHCEIVKHYLLTWCVPDAAVIGVSAFDFLSLCSDPLSDDCIERNDRVANFKALRVLRALRLVSVERAAPTPPAHDGACACTCTFQALASAPLMHASCACMRRAA